MVTCHVWINIKLIAGLCLFRLEDTDRKYGVVESHNPFVTWWCHPWDSISRASQGTSGRFGDVKKLCRQVFYVNVKWVHKEVKRELLVVNLMWASHFIEFSKTERFNTRYISVLGSEMYCWWWWWWKWLWRDQMCCWWWVIIGLKIIMCLIGVSWILKTMRDEKCLGTELMAIT